jgi:hypothetical protein
MVKELTIPAEYQDSFRREALFALESAAGQIETMTRFMREGRRGLDNPDTLERDLETFHATLAVYRQVGVGDFEFAADDDAMEHVLQSAVQGCLIHATDDAKGGAEDVDHSTVLLLLDEARSGWPGSTARR